MAKTIPTRRSGFGTPVWRVVLTIIGIVLIAYGLFNTLFGVLGTEISADVTQVQPQGKFNDKALAGGRGTVEVSYTFTLPDGRTFSGKSTYGTNVDYSDPEKAAALKTISVHYLSFWPQINRASVLTGFQADTLVFPIIGLLLIVMINWRAVRHKKLLAEQEARQAAGQAVSQTPDTKPIQPVQADSAKKPDAVSSSDSSDEKEETNGSSPDPEAADPTLPEPEPDQGKSH